MIPLDMMYNLCNMFEESLDKIDTVWKLQDYTVTTVAQIIKWCSARDRKNLKFPHCDFSKICPFILGSQYTNSM